MLNKFKEAFQKEQVQFVLFDDSGKCVESDDNFFPISTQSNSVFEAFDFLESYRDLLSLMQVGEDYEFPCMNMKLNGKDAYFDFTLKRVYLHGEELNLWIIHDQTALYLNILDLQQDRNNKAISGEFFELKQRALNAERDLLKFKNEELQRLQDFKTQFYAKFSHELRTPLHSIAGLSTLLEQRNTIEKQTQYLKALQSTSRHLLSFVNNVIDLARLEKGKVEWQSVETTLRDLVEEVLASFRYVTEKKGLQLSVHYAENFPSYAFLDAVKLKQILFNMVGNAVKFTSEGQVLIKASLESRSKEKEKLQFLIIDTGEGIPKDKQAQLFKPYTQFDTGEIGGSGLGLSIVRQLCELFDGSVEYVDTVEKGATFKILLPYIPVEKEKIPKPIHTNEKLTANIKKILIADDDDINRKVLSIYCKKNGIETRTVNTGAKAMEVLAQFDCDLIILDYYMPEMDGITALSKIKGNPKFEKIPVFMLTGDTTSKIRDNLYVNGASRVIAKPIQPQNLFAIINNWYNIDSSSINLAYLHKIADNNPKLVQDLVKKFLNTVPEDLSKIKAFAEKGDYVSLRKLLHKTKINMKYVGMEKAFTIMEKLELALGKDILLDNFEKEISTLEMWIEKAIKSLKDQYKSL